MVERSRRRTIAPWLYSDGEAQWECASGYCGWSDAYVLASVREGHMHGLVEKDA